ncbi:MAG: ABC transporter ATP-binding protein [Gemmatimonadetes bacterium]|nr:MAG: ABC transporter ATP-binding protein [Gemmatimonadota bacterium]
MPSPAAGIRLDAKNISWKAGSTLILSHISLSFFPAECVGLLGPSGAGKSTLLKTLCGILTPSEGQVRVNGDDFRHHRDRLRYFLGYVPQDDIVHRTLTVYNALHYAALLRFPPGTPSATITSKVDTLIRQLGLAERRRTRISRLSGGQRKRVSVGVELLTEPWLLFLDEPTSGLDPGTEEKMMKLFRGLADEGRTVILTTHVMESLHLLDLVVILVKGVLAFCGPPAAALPYFRVDDFADIYKALDKQSPRAWADRFRRSDLYQEYVADRLQQPCSLPLPEIPQVPAVTTSARKPPRTVQEPATPSSSPQPPSTGISSVESELERLKRELGQK